MQKRENNQAKDARSAALTVLLRCERNGAWLDGALKNVLKESALEPRDAALCQQAVLRRLSEPAAAGVLAVEIFQA